MARYIYRQNGDGAVKAVCVSDKLPQRSPSFNLDQNFHQTVLDAYRQVEESGRWQGPFPKSMVKRVHEQAMERTSRQKAA